MAERLNTAQESKVAEPVMDEAQRLREANDIVRNRVAWSVGVGLVPIPLVDMAGLMAMQLEMLARLARLYGVPFRRDLGKSLVASLVSSVIPALAAGPLASMIKLIPIVGYTAGAVTMCAVGGASTYAVGKVFTKHFASGGTLLDFDPVAVKDEFAAHFQEGKAAAAEIKKGA